MSSKKHKTLTAEEQKRIRIRARRRFKACVRLVIANLFWLEDMEGEALGEDVKKNVLLLLKKKKDKKSLLTLYEKTILCKAASERTEEEKLQLFKVIGDLKCFRKYPTDVKMSLAAVCYFVYFPPGRVIVKQYGEGKSLYFIMSGEVSVSITIYDPILNEHKTTMVGTMEAGQMFGEVSLLHNIPRTATITTITHCEMILLHKKDFDTVLKSSLQEVWDQILFAMSRFKYFDNWDEVSMRECCIYSRIVTYRMGDIVFGSGAHSDNYVHFVLDGTCTLIETLPVVPSFYAGKKYIDLFDMEVYKEHMKRERARKESRAGSMAKRISKPRVSIKKSNISLASKHSTSSFDMSAEDMRKKKTDETKKLLGMVDEKEEEVEMPDFVKKVYMQVCIFGPLACFGLGERMRFRKIVASTDYVECLLIPKFWIWTKNFGNVWTTVIHTLGRILPNTEQVFKIFLANREWGRVKRELVNKLANKPPCNTLNNVPYSIRLANDIDYGVCYGNSEYPHCS